MTGCSSSTPPNVANSPAAYSNEPVVQQMKLKGETVKPDPNVAKEAAAALQSNPHMPDSVKAQVLARVQAQLAAQESQRQ